jgi:hypothetical protein
MVCVLVSPMIRHHSRKLIFISVAYLTMYNYLRTFYIMSIDGIRFKPELGTAGRVASSNPVITFTGRAQIKTLLGQSTFGGC